MSCNEQGGPPIKNLLFLRGMDKGLIQAVVEFQVPAFVGRMQKYINLSWKRILSSKRIIFISITLSWVTLRNSLLFGKIMGIITVI